MVFPCRLAWNACLPVPPPPGLRCPLLARLLDSGAPPTAAIAVLAGPYRAPRRQYQGRPCPCHRFIMDDQISIFLPKQARFAGPRRITADAIWSSAAAVLRRLADDASPSPEGLMAWPGPVCPRPDARIPADPTARDGARWRCGGLRRADFRSGRRPASPGLGRMEQLRLFLTMLAAVLERPPHDADWLAVLSDRRCQAEQREVASAR